MTRIYLVRHGLVDNPQQVFYGSEFLLSERGRLQLAGIAEDMRAAHVVPAVIRHSPFVRTTQSMEAFCSVLPCADVSVDPRLIEWQVGSWFDRPLADFYAATSYDQSSVEAWVFGSDVESHAHMAMRMLEAMTELVAVHAGKDLVLISHREPIVCALLALQHRSFSEVHDVLCPVASAWEICLEGERVTSIRCAFDRSADGHAHAMG